MFYRLLVGSRCGTGQHYWGLPVFAPAAFFHCTPSFLKGGPRSQPRKKKKKYTVSSSPSTKKLARGIKPTGKAVGRFGFVNTASMRHQPSPTKGHREIYSREYQNKPRLDRDIRKDVRESHFARSMQRSRAHRDRMPYSSPDEGSREKFLKEYRSKQRSNRDVSRRDAAQPKLAQSSRYESEEDEAKQYLARSNREVSKRDLERQFVQPARAVSRADGSDRQVAHSEQGPHHGGRSHDERSHVDLQLPTTFTSPPLLPGLLQSVMEVLGPTARPTPIQALSLKHLFTNIGGWRHFLLASETGSGKSMAYMLPMLQDLKQSELSGHDDTHRRPGASKLNPRALILAPTHELSRQLTGFAKALLHNIKLRAMSASRANLDSGLTLDESSVVQANETQLVNKTRLQKQRDVDVLVGTPNKLMEMVRGFRWADLQKERSRRISQPEMGLGRVEWVIVDEADVLFDPDFTDTTKLLLADIKAAKQHVTSSHVDASETSLSSPSDSLNSSHARQPSLQLSLPSLPFNLILSTATIPSSLAAFLDSHHPNLKRLTSPGLHMLPRSLATEYVPWSGSGRWSDVEKRIRQVWAEEAGPVPRERSKVLVFCNKGTTVDALGKYLDAKGVKNIPLTSQGSIRKRGNNHHLDGFLKSPKNQRGASPPTLHESLPLKKDKPHVLITTSLLSRGLDFEPSIRHVLITEPPRNMIDFLHRAGRSGRAGNWGRVVVFVKARGRGSARSEEVKRSVGRLTRTRVGQTLDARWDEGQDGGALVQWGDVGSERGMEFAMGRDGRKARSVVPPPPGVVVDSDHFPVEHKSAVATS